MRLWRVVVLTSLAIAILVILASAVLEAQGRIHLPWPTVGPQIGGRLRFFGTQRLALAGPYVEAVAGLILQALIGTVVLYAAPERMRRLTDAVADGWTPFFRFFLIGALLALGLGAVAVLSAFYVHTAMLPFLLGGVLFLGALAGWVSLTLALGRALLRRAAWSGGSPLWSLLLGATLLYAVTRLPYIAPFAMALLALTGAGAALSTRFGGRRTWSLDPLREVPQE
ncbi:MAG TPA: hypothetical protein VK449_09095 [Anaerolineales bacterium]|nr:hypothetical protein [Anaerolineales bacterium]